eukprot:SAG25_NODE_1042_length_4197_cov_5.368960_1_plen_58_part_00
MTTLPGCTVSFLIASPSPLAHRAQDIQGWVERAWACGWDPPGCTPSPFPSPPHAPLN